MINITLNKLDLSFEGIFYYNNNNNIHLGTHKIKDNQINK